MTGGIPRHIIQSNTNKTYSCVAYNGLYLCIWNCNNNKVVGICNKIKVFRFVWDHSIVAGILEAAGKLLQFSSIPQFIIL